MTTELEQRTAQLWHHAAGLPHKGSSLTYRGDTRGPSLEVRDGDAWRPATDAERRAVRVEELAERYLDREVLACQSSLVDAMLKAGEELPPDLRDGWSWEDVENLRPDPSDWDIEQCREWLDERGIGHPDPDPWAMTEEELRDYLPDDQRPGTVDEMRAAVIDCIDGDDGALDDWREAVREADPEEVLEWWLVSKWLGRELRQAGMVVLENDYGFWWGRTCTGQALIMDGVLQQVAASHAG